MDKIYSRKRIKLPKIKIFFSNNNRGGKYSRYFKKILITAFVLTFVIGAVVYRIKPSIVELSVSKAKAYATLICNNAILDKMNNIKYSDLIEYTYDSNGTITTIKADSIKMNQLASNITSKIQLELEELYVSSIKIPIGSFTNIQILYGTGPEVNIKILQTGSIDTKFESELISAGINQTIHRIYIEVKCSVTVLGPFTNVLGTFEEKVPVAETVIVGNVPSSFYNLEGLNLTDTTTLMEKK